MAGANLRWRDPAPLARPIRLLQWALAALGAVMAAFDLARLTLAAQAPPGLAMGEATTPLLDKLTGLGAFVALGNGLVLAVAGVMSLMWFVRTNGNAHLWAQGLRVSPGWAAGWFFVPVASLWKPFQCVNDTWRASVEPPGWPALAAPVLLRWWWALFLADNVLGQISGRLEIAARTVEQNGAASLVSLIGDLVGVALAFVFACVVRDLTALQAGRATGPAAAPFDASHVFGP